MPAAQPGQLHLGLLAGLDVDEVGQAVTKTANYRHVAITDFAIALCSGGSRQPRRQRFASD